MRKEDESEPFGLRGTGTRALVALVVLGNLAYALTLPLVHRPANGYVTWCDGWLFHAAITAPALLTIRRARRARQDRRRGGAWWWITLGVLANTVAQLQYTYWDQNQHPIPFPAWSDAWYLVSYAGYAIGFVLLTQTGLGVSRVVRLDGFVVGLTGGAIAVAIWFDPVLHQTGSTSAVLVGLAYPLFDLVYLVVIGAGLAPQGYRLGVGTSLLAAGVGLFALGDVVYLNQVAAGTYVGGTLLEATWSIGTAVIGLAAAVPSRRARAASDRQVIAVVPMMGSFCALGVLGAAQLARVPPLAVWLAIAAVGTSMSRVGLSVRELRRANEAFRQARTDELTGLLNRRGFAELLDEHLTTPTDVAVLMIDLDGFKEVNDSLGHHAGDLLLDVVATRLSRALPRPTRVARLGGDEFGVALVGASPTADEAVAAIEAALTDPVALDGVAVRIAASVGIAVADEHDRDRDELLRAADVAMYEAKSNHRTSSRYDADRDPHSRDRLQLIEDLRTAISERSFAMHYQPTIDVGTGDVVGMEALIRWDHPERGLLMPNDFIPLAERIGLIPAVTRAVIDLAIAELARKRNAGNDLRLSVNISALDLVDDSLPAYVHQTLLAHEVPPHQLTLEVTETAISNDSVRARRTLETLRSLGVRVSIDDFGVGYSSMSQLLKLPLDELKIDRSFIANLETDVRARAILSATVELGRTLGLDIVAEGIETQAALAEVAERGVDVAQGFLFAPALSSDALQEFLEQRSRASSGR